MWETRDFPDHPYNKVVAMPDDVPLPPIWLLGSSDYSSELAAQVGMGFAFAHHFATYDAVAALTNYHHVSSRRAGARRRTAFLRSRQSRPRPMRKRNGWPRRWSSTACAATVVNMAAAERRGALAYPYTDAERASIVRNRARLFTGTPATIMAKLQPMITESQADQLMIITAVYDHEARKNPTACSPTRGPPERGGVMAGGGGGGGARRSILLLD